jgi:hypothetical protein
MSLKLFFTFLVVPLFLVSATRKPCPPFVSGDAFRASCDYIFDETDTSLDPGHVGPKSTLFVKGDYLGRFFERIHPYLPHPYLLVTHNSDNSAPGAFSSYLQDEKLIAWFAQNLDDPSHPKMHPIPIGIANRAWKHGNGRLMKKILAQHLPKSHLLYLNIVVSTYPQERTLVYNLLSPFAYRTSAQPFERYLRDVATSTFVASPRGNGLDTHRLWESLYLGAYPIVKSSTLDSLYADLPVLIVQDWSEVTEEFLNQKYLELKGKKYPIDKLSIDYWLQQIHALKSMDP